MRTGSVVAVVLGVLLLIGGIGDLVSTILVSTVVSGISGGQSSVSMSLYLIPAVPIIGGILLIVLGVRLDHPARKRRR